MSNPRPRRSTPAAPRALAAQAKVAAHATDDLLARGEALAAKALRGRADDPLAAPVLVGADGTLDAAEATWAALGALERGQLAAARATLEALLGQARPDGLLPVRLARRSPLIDRVAAWLGRPAAPRALDRAAFAACARDGARVNALLAWAAAEYATRAGDGAFARRWAPTLEAAIGWIDAQPGPATAGCEAAYHQAQMAMGHLAIASGDAVAGARRWAAAAAAKGRIQDAEREAQAPVADELLAVYVGACDQATAADALGRADMGLAGLAALAAIRTGELATAQALLDAAAAAAVEADAFADASQAGTFVRALGELRQAVEAAAQAAKARPKRRQLQLSEEEARILSAC